VGWHLGLGAGGWVMAFVDGQRMLCCKRETISMEVGREGAAERAPSTRRSTLVYTSGGGASGPVKEACWRCAKLAQGQSRHIVCPLSAPPHRFLLAGPTSSASSGPNPDPSWLTDKAWVELCNLSALPAFQGFASHVMQVRKARGYWEPAQAFDLATCWHCRHPSALQCA
jgi:hypothetical protein